MPREKKPLPALDNASIVRNPDLSEISNRNYTDTILRYGGLATKFPQLETDAKTIVAAINELYAHPGGSIVIPNPEIGDELLTEDNEPLWTEDDQPLLTEQGSGGGGTVVGELNSISIDGDIYTIPSGGGGGGDGKHRTLTEAEYDALSEAEKNNGTIYFIEDEPAVVLRPEDLRSENAHIGQLLSYTAYGMWEPTVDVGALNNGDILAWKNNTWAGKHLVMGDIATISSPQAGQAIVYDSVNHIWKNGTVSTVGQLNDLTDVGITSPLNGQVLKYDNGEWINANESTGVAELDDLNDVTITSASNGQVLKYDNGTWVNAADAGGSTVSVTQIQSTGTKIATITVDSVGTDLYAPNGGATVLDDLTDVSISSVTDGQVLAYDSNSGEWVNDTISVTVDAEDVDYDNTTSGLTADDVQEAIDEVVDNLDDKAEYVELTQLEYDALSPAEKSNGTLYFITDANGDGSQFQPVIYSGEEREIGVWTDGKPLYERTFNLSNVTFTDNAWNNDILGTDSSGILIQKFDGYFSLSGSSMLLPLCYYRGSSEYFTCLTNSDASDLNVRPNMNAGTNVIGSFIIIQYTKTTDTAGSGQWTPQGVPAHHYSEDEQVVGTWIDGSTLYEKTFAVTQNPNSVTKVSLGSLVVDTLMFVSGYMKETTTGNVAPLSYYSSASDEFSAYYEASTNSIVVKQGWVGSGYITIQYTKSSS